MQPVELRNRVVGAVTSDVREFEGRQVVWVDVDAGSRVGALTSDSSGKIENASVTARAKGFPLIVIMRSSGADIVEGFAALHGWGLAARGAHRLLRGRADHHGRRGSGGLRALRCCWGSPTSW